VRGAGHAGASGGEPLTEQAQSSQPEGMA